jgi:hypothetical protein
MPSLLWPYHQLDNWVHSENTNNTNTQIFLLRFGGSENTTNTLENSKKPVYILLNKF